MVGNADSLRTIIEVQWNYFVPSVKPENDVGVSYSLHTTLQMRLCAMHIRTHVLADPCMHG